MKKLSSLENDSEKLLLLGKKPPQDIELLVNRLHNLVKPLAPFLAEPGEKAIVENPVLFQKEIERIKVLTSDWFASKGLAKAIATYYNKLQKVFASTPFNTATQGDTNTNSNNTDKQVVLSSNLDQTLQAWKEFDDIKQENDYFNNLSEKNSENQLETLQRNIIKNPPKMQESANKLFNLTKLLEKIITLS